MKLFFAFILAFMPMVYGADLPSSPPSTSQVQSNKAPTDHPSSPSSQQTPQATEEELPAETPSPEEMPVTYKGAFAKMMLTLLALILLIVISVWMLRRIGQGRFRQLSQGRQIKVLERRPLSAKTVLYVVEVGQKKVLVAESQLEVRSIASIDEIYPSED